MTQMNGLDDLGLAVPCLRISLHLPAGAREPAYTRLSLSQRRKKFELTKQLHILQPHLGDSLLLRLYKLLYLPGITDITLKIFK